MDSMETSTTPQPTESTPSSSLPQSSSIPSTPEIPPSPNPNPNPNPNPTQNPQPSTPLQQQQQQQQSALQHSQARPSLNRPRPQPPYTHFSPHFQSLASSSASSSSSLSSPASSPLSTPPLQRGGLAIGVPAHHPRPPQQPTSFSSFGSSSFNQQFGGLGRNSVTMPDSIANSNTTQGRQPIQGIHSIGMIGSLSSGSHMRPSTQQQQRPVQPSIRSQSPTNNQSLATQKFQGHGLLRASPMGSPGSPSPGTPQGLQSHTQPWMSSGSQGKPIHPPPLPSPSFRPQMKPQSFQQRSHIPQQHHHTLATASHQQMSSAQQQQQPSLSHQSQEHYGQQYPPPRVSQSVLHQQQITRGQGSGNQKSASLAPVQPTIVQSGPHTTTAIAEAGECSNQILSKRSIHELVTQIDPSERLDPEVEDILVEIADEFVESITTFGCLLAKHRKSTTLEAKDILLHLERNWNMTLPGFGGDEIKIYKKPYTNDIHKERLAAIKKSIVGSEMANIKSSAGQPTGNAKGHAAKVLVMGSPRTREVP